MASILVVEDEPAIADTLVYALRTEGMTVRWVGLGRDKHDPQRICYVGIAGITGEFVAAHGINLLFDSAAALALSSDECQLWR